MATTTETTSVGTTPSTGGLNYADYQKRIQDAAAKTRNIGSTKLSPELSVAAAKLPTQQGAVGTAAITNYQSQVESTQKQAGKAASALEMVGSSTLQGMKNLEGIQASIKAQVQSASESWGAAAEKADEYVQAARGRVGEVLSKLDEINQQIGTDRDFAKAHAMQGAVQGVMGSMKAEERNIAETYGTDSKEFAQFVQSKGTTLATIQSNIHANYSQLREQQGQTYLNVVSDAYTKSNMYVGFQEQQHVEMLKYKEDAKNAFALQAAQLDISIEQMKMAGMENLANWIIETPTFSMDSTPLITLISDLQSTAAAEQRANMIAGSQAALTSAQAREQEFLTGWNKRIASGGRGLRGL